MPDRPDLPGLINALYDTVAAPADWPAGLALIAAQFGARTGHAFFLPDASGPPALNAVSPATAAEYMRDYVPMDPRLPLFAQHVGKAVRCVDVVPVDVMEKSPLVPFLDRPDVGARWCLVAPFQIRSGQFGFVSALRPRARGSFEDADVAAFKALSPHLKRIVELHLRLDELSARADRGEAALHALATALLLADTTGRITFANRAAEALFRDGDVRVRNHALLCRHPTDTVALHKIIHAAANAPQAGKAEANTHILQRGDGKGPLVAVALPLPWRHPAATLNRRAHVAVFLLDPTAEIDIPASLLRQLGCTPAEIRLAQALAKGESPADFAASHALSRETVRTQLAQLFRKTDTSRQAALLAFLNRCVSGSIFR